MENKTYTTKLTTNEILTIQLSIQDSVDINLKKGFHYTAKAKMKIFDMLENLLNE